ncbi:anti-sigma factor family protein [Streptomyces fuscigenes]|uniref:anti-sigma factor family protein n=1 Tax=Streptomyces fuscigenes TaxID=1528880 RepID=UPI0027DEBC6C|nr:zf-HC2 domain-containing protein [Streptomyces fuscigenes]
MTSSSGTDRHPDVEEISDLVEGLLPPTRALDLRGHLDDCDDCADVHRSLAEIRDLLGTLPGPAPMPADVAQRIDAALAAEALLDAVPSADVAVDHPHPFIPTPAGVRSDARSREGAAGESPVPGPGDEGVADAGNVEHAGLADALSENAGTTEDAVAAEHAQDPRHDGDAGHGDGTQDGPAPQGRPHGEESEALSPRIEATPGMAPGRDVSRETSRSSRSPGGPVAPATGPRRSTSGPGRGRPSRRRRGAVGLGAALGIAVLGIGAYLLQGTGTQSDVGAAEQAASPHITAATTSADDFSGARLETRVDTLLNTTSGNAPQANPDLRGSTANSDAASNEPLMQSAPQVPYCVRQGTGRTEAILAAQQGSYRGAPAYLLVLANPADEAKVRVYVIDATCVGATPPAKGKILQTELYSRR